MSATTPALMPAVDLWLRCLPLPGEAQGFFAPLPRAAAARLRASRCIPTEGGECYESEETVSLDHLVL